MKSKYFCQSFLSRALFPLFQSFLHSWSIQKLPIAVLEPRPSVCQKQPLCQCLNNPLNVFQNQHCILNIHLEAVERLHHNEIYPIVLMIKFKSVKQIKEVKDPRCHGDKISQKDAKTIFELSQKFESEYPHLISGSLNFITWDPD